MPCMDGGPDPRAVRNEELSRQVKDLSAMLCSACRELASRGYDFGLNPMLDRWWDDHQEEDRARRERQAAKDLRRRVAEVLLTKPINELTAEDREMLRSEGLL